MWRTFVCTTSSHKACGDFKIKSPCTRSFFNPRPKNYEKYPVYVQDEAFGANSVNWRSRPIRQTVPGINLHQHLALLASLFLKCAAIWIAWLITLNILWHFAGDLDGDLARRGEDWRGGFCRRTFLPPRWFNTPVPDESHSPSRHLWRALQMAFSPRCCSLSMCGSLWALRYKEEKKTTPKQITYRLGSACQSVFLNPVAVFLASMPTVKWYMLISF